TEYSCTILARAIGLAAPECHVAMMPDGRELCFASREEGGAEDGANFLEMVGNRRHMTNFAGDLTRWYAFDLFVRNFDRHIGNFLFRRSMVGVTMLGIDFSHALLAQDWPAAPPPLPQCNTTHVRSLLRQIAPAEPRATVTVVNRLADVPDEWLKERIAETPPDWLDAKLATDVCRWWRRGRAKRLRQLRTHLTNGRYLHLLAHPHRSRQPAR